MNIKAKLNYQQYFSIVNSAFEEGSNIRITGIFSSTGRAKKWRMHQLKNWINEINIHE